jgi:hypothetical protein
MDKDLKTWIISVEMGLGHKRAVFPLKYLAYEKILFLGEKETANESEIKLWNRMRKTYESLSRVKSFPIIGEFLFKIIDKAQEIPTRFQYKDLTSPTIQVKFIYNYFKKGLGKTLMEKIKSHPLPIISSYPIAALIADYYHYPVNYCIICDAEISRAWVAENPHNSKIKYFAPCGNAVRRLKSYGVPDDRIFLTGFPFPKELLGDRDLNILKYDVAQRLHYLDPKNRFFPLHEKELEHFLGVENLKFKNDRVLSITFCIGGAGAQSDIAEKALKSLKTKINDGEIKFNVVVGKRKNLYDHFINYINEIGINPKNVYILYGINDDDYFEKFSKLIRVTDILWTKPSELSFYAGLGLPILLAPIIGSQEYYNRKWLLEIQAGILQEEPEFTNIWLFELLEDGRFAEAAWDGFLKARKYGTYKIEEILETGTMVRETNILKR